MHTDREYEKIAIIVILSGCGVAIALAFAVLICCQLLIKPKYSQRNCHLNSQVVVFERQTTTSDENNAENYSCCYEDSVYQQQCDSDTNGDTISSPNTVIAQTHHIPSTNAQIAPQQRSSSPQVKFTLKPVKNRKASLPCKLVSVQQKEEKCSNNSKDYSRRSSAGIIRQKSFDDTDVEINQTKTENANNENPIETKEEIPSTDALRKQYKELWQLRATFEAEEMELSNESSDSLPSNQPRNVDQKLTKNDSGYKSIERRDYSIDYKTEYIFRQFTATTPQRYGIHHQQSIKEEQENEVQATFV